MACTSVRIDNKDFNSGFTQNIGPIIHNVAAGVVYFVWSAQADAGANPFHNREVVFNTFNTTTRTAGTPKIIDTTATNFQDWDGVCMLRLTTGRLIVAAGQFSVDTWESTDNGATWTASAKLDAGANRTFGGMITDGTEVWAITQESAGGGGQLDTYAVRRTGVSSWAAPLLIHDSPGFSTSPFYIIDNAYCLSSMRCGAMKDANTMFFVLGYSSLNANEDQIRCLWTTNAWATINNTLVKDYVGLDATAAFARIPYTLKGSDNRCRTLWIRNDPINGEVPVLAYTDDWGKNWTVVGTPPLFTTVKSWDALYNRAFALDADNRIYCSTLDSVDASNTKQRLFKGGDSLSGWVLSGCENLGFSWSNATAGDGFIVGSDFYRVFDQLRAGPIWSVDVLLQDNVTTGGGGSVPLVTESPSGSDAANIYLRNRLSTGRGWSAHDLPVAAWAVWPEGDYTTQRLLPILLAGASSIDPSVSDPSTIPAIWKVDDPERYDREVWAYDEIGNFVSRGDPFTFEWRSKAFSLVNRSGLKWGLARGFVICYRRPFGDVTIETWIDGKPSQSDVLPASGPDLMGRDVAALSDPLFYPIATDDNLGTVCQLRIVDETNIPFVIETIGIMRIEKGPRG